MKFLAILGLCVLCALTDVKIGDIQPVEIWTFACLCIGAILLLIRGGVITGSPLAVKLLPAFMLFFGLVFMGSLLSLRLKFYPPADFGPLKAPPWASFVRLVQVVVAMASMFIVMLAIGKSRRNLDLAMTLYAGAAVISASWALISGVGFFYDIELPGAYALEGLRLRGFFVEGGPFGVYLAGAIVLQCVRRFVFRSVPLISFVIQTAILIIALLGAQSKAAILLLLLLGAYMLYLKGNVGIVVLAPLLVVPLLASSNLYEGLNGYFQTFTGFDRAVRLRPDDPSLVMGRIMGAILLPRMVEQHPFIGIGIGNYSLMRNDPEILRGLPTTAQWDLPGLGLLGYVAELGIPLTLFALWLYSAPMRHSRTKIFWLGGCAAYPVLAAIFGVQLNFAYPWIMSGIVLSAISMAPDVSTAAKRRPLIGLARRRRPAIRNAPV